jgi:hypothetical protein
MSSYMTDSTQEFNNFYGFKLPQMLMKLYKAHQKNDEMAIHSLLLTKYYIVYDVDAMKSSS